MSTPVGGSWEDGELLEEDASGGNVYAGYMDTDWDSSAHNIGFPVAEDRPLFMALNRILNDHGTEPDEKEPVRGTCAQAQYRPVTSPTTPVHREGIGDRGSRGATCGGRRRRESHRGVEQEVTDLEMQYVLTPYGNGPTGFSCESSENQIKYALLACFPHSTPASLLGACPCSCGVSKCTTD